MEINCKDMPVYILNLRDDEDRRQFMSDQMERLGLNYQFVQAIKCDPSPIGIALSHLKAIRLNARPPFLIVEDDCQFLEEHFTTEFELPDEADALYLGHSEFGLRDEKDQFGVRWGQQGNTKYRHYDADYLRVFNMLARHAIVYLSERYIYSAMEANLGALLDNDFSIPGDIMYAEMQPQHIVLTPNQHICYQSGDYGGVQGATFRSLPNAFPPFEGDEY